MTEKYSVLMSLYVREKASNLKECLESLVKQTTFADEWVIVKDGPLTEELEDVLKEYENKFPNLIHYVVFENNQGLGLALRAGVQSCRNELIARMDTDDVCVPRRMEKQLAEFKKNPNLDICGSHNKEFDGEVNNIISERKVPLTLESIRKYQRTRSAFNHMTVMFKKTSVINAGNYEHAPLMEDDMLWIRMLHNGCIGMNLDEYLVFARTGLNMIARRGGYSYFKKYKETRKKILQTGYISKNDYFYTIAIQFIICLMPQKFRKFIFVNILR